MRPVAARLLGVLVALSMPLAATHAAGIDFGPTLPPAGRSLFDRLTDGGRALPYPFAALLDQIAARVGDEARPASRHVMIPIGRSLQRFAAVPDVFASPRIVVAWPLAPQGKGAGPPPLRDRLFLGYQPAADSVEIISYNEAAARFEFQEIRDYGPGGSPELVYADRELCLSCHQNQAPIFARAPWDESTANARVVRALVDHGPSRAGLPVARAFDAAFQIDASAARANEIATWQALWQQGCPDAACRADLLRVALRSALSGYRLAIARDPSAIRVVARLNQGAATAWPEGLAIPTGALPDVDPLAGGEPDDAALDRLLRPEGPFDPATIRAPAAVWTSFTGADDARFARLVTGIAGLFGRGDLATLDGALLAASTSGKGRLVRLGCRQDDARLICGDGDERLVATINVGPPMVGTIVTSRHGRLLNLATRVTAKGAASLDLSLQDLTNGLTARFRDGVAIRSVRLEGIGGATPAALISLVDDGALLDDAIDGALHAAYGPLGSGPFARERIMSALLEALGQGPACCATSDADLPPPVAG